MQELVGYRRAGWQLIPLRRWNSKAKVKRGGKEVEIDAGKMPAHAKWRTNPYPGAALKQAIACGRNIGVRLSETQLVLDYDPRNDPTGETPALLEIELGAWLDSAPKVITGSGGIHWYCLIPAGEKLRNASPLFPGLEFKGYGKQVVAAGSKHPNGRFYEWDPLSPPMSAAPMLPASFIELIRPDEIVQGDDEPGELTNEQLEVVLSKLDVTKFQDHDAWLEIGMASWYATAGEGCDAFVEWSTSDELYADQGPLIAQRWKTWAPKPGMPARTTRTLYMRVAEAGGDLEIYSDLFPDDLPAEPQAPPASADEGLGVPVFGSDPVAALAKMNELYSVVPEGSSAFIYGPASRPEDSFSRLRVDTFKTLLQHRQIALPGAGGNLRNEQLAETWLKWSKRRTMRGVVFDPDDRAPAGYFNTWRGWGVKPDSSKPCAMIKRVVREVIADGDEECASYIMRWSAWMVQNPGAPAEVACVFLGRKGTGKSTYAQEVLMRIAGRHGRMMSRDLAGRFNGPLRDCVFLFADEAFWAGNKMNEGHLKAMITARALQYEFKGVDVQQGRNYLHLMIASNESWVVPASIDERRFAVFRVSDDRIGDVPFWTAVYDEIERDGGVSGFFAYLLDMDLGDWHPRYEIPKTEALATQKVASMGTVGQWLFKLLQSGELPAEIRDAEENSDWHAGPVEIERLAVQESFRNHAGRSMASERAIATELGAQLRQILPSLTEVRRQDEGDRRRMYLFPPLAQCRAEFEQSFGKIDWA